MNENKTARLYDKLRKLIALKDSALYVGSVREAAAIQRLLREYNLSEEEIPEGERIANPIIMEDLPYYFVYRTTWFRNMVTDLAKNNLCELVANVVRVGSRSTGQNLTVIGRETNVRMVTFIATQLANRFVAFCRQEYASYRQRKIRMGLTPSSEAVFARNYLIGCVSGLSQRLKEQNRPTEMGLVLSRKAENDAFIKERFDNLGKLKAKTPVVENRQAFLDGYRKGKEVDIYEGIDKSRDKPKPIG